MVLHAVVAGSEAEDSHLFFYFFFKKGVFAVSEKKNLLYNCYKKDNL